LSLSFLAAWVFFVKPSVCVRDLKSRIDSRARQLLCSLSVEHTNSIVDWTGQERKKLHKLRRYGFTGRAAHYMTEAGSKSRRDKRWIVMIGQDKIQQDKTGWHSAANERTGQRHQDVDRGPHGAGRDRVSEDKTGHYWTWEGQCGIRQDSLPAGCVNVALGTSQVRRLSSDWSRDESITPVSGPVSDSKPGDTNTETIDFESPSITSRWISRGSCSQSNIYNCVHTPTHTQTHTDTHNDDIGLVSFTRPVSPSLSRWGSCCVWISVGRNGPQAYRIFSSMEGGLYDTWRKLLAIKCHILSRLQLVKKYSPDKVPTS